MVSTIESTNPSTIVWAAGAGGGSPERTRAVDNEGAIKSMDATAKAGVTKRYIIISAVDVRDRENKPEPEWYDDGDRDRSNKVWGAIGVCSVFLTISPEAQLTFVVNSRTWWPSSPQTEVW